MALCLTSIDFAKRERVLQDLERTSWDVIVIDEAHHCVRMGGVGDFEDSWRRRLAEVLARKSDALVLLTATPHDGYDPHFASRVELLDPSLVDGRGALRGEQFRGHVIGRPKEDIKDPRTGRCVFQQRHVTPCPVSRGPRTHPGSQPAGPRSPPSWSPIVLGLLVQAPGCLLQVLLSSSLPTNV